ncbi:hypothetical protein DPMN_031978 [Dreissena polymorpha]|uniref:Uncharacterized protein n=1 Tax=Dreissena polymorpha TaxID=45954 RepID=A0A9D4M3T5_DREPO|nr:hypothetical protein DPMN_031978 [Dreissena polymorpha]
MQRVSVKAGDLTCGGCRHSRRADRWSAFTENVDDAVPLALPTVHEVVRDIGVCTDLCTVGGNGVTGGVVVVKTCSPKMSMMQFRWRNQQFVKLSVTLRFAPTRAL